jgi:hypothetical protein
MAWSGKKKRTQKGDIISIGSQPYFFGTFLTTILCPVHTKQNESDGRNSGVKAVSIADLCVLFDSWNLSSLFSTLFLLLLELHTHSNQGLHISTYCGQGERDAMEVFSSLHFATLNLDTERILPKSALTIHLSVLRMW